MKNRRVFDEFVPVNDFDLQLFGDETATQDEKIVVGGKEYSAQEIAEGLLASSNKKAWEKSNTEKAQAIADERKKFADEQTVAASWLKVGEKYTDDPLFAVAFDKLYLGESLSPAEEEIFGSSSDVTRAMEGKIASLEKMVVDMQMSELDKMRFADMKDVAATITTNADPFTIDDVERLAEDKGKTYSEAYLLMRAQHIDHYKKVAGDGAIESYKKKQPPIVPPIGSGGGVYQETKPFNGWRNAAAKAAEAHPNVFR